MHLFQGPFDAVQRVRLPLTGDSQLVLIARYLLEAVLFFFLLFLTLHLGLRGSGVYWNCESVEFDRRGRWPVS